MQQDRATSEPPKVQAWTYLCQLCIQKGRKDCDGHNLALQAAQNGQDLGSISCTPCLKQGKRCSYNAGKLRIGPLFSSRYPHVGAQMVPATQQLFEAYLPRGGCPQPEDLIPIYLKAAADQRRGTARFQLPPSSALEDFFDDKVVRNALASTQQRSNQAPAVQASLRSAVHHRNKKLLPQPRSNGNGLSAPPGPKSWRDEQAKRGGQGLHNNVYGVRPAGHGVTLGGSSLQNFGGGTGLNAGVGMKAPGYGMQQPAPGILNRAFGLPGAQSGTFGGPNGAPGYQNGLPLVALNISQRDQPGLRQGTARQIRPNGRVGRQPTALVKQEKDIIAENADLRAQLQAKEDELALARAGQVYMPGSQMLPQHALPPFRTVEQNQVGMACYGCQGVHRATEVCPAAPQVCMPGPQAISQDASSPFYAVDQNQIAAACFRCLGVHPAAAACPTASQGVALGAGDVRAEPVVKIKIEPGTEAKQRADDEKKARENRKPREEQNARVNKGYRGGQSQDPRLRGRGEYGRGGGIGGLYR